LSRVKGLIPHPVSVGSEIEASLEGALGKCRYLRCNLMRRLKSDLPARVGEKRTRTARMTRSGIFSVAIGLVCERMRSEKATDVDSKMNGLGFYTASAGARVLLSENAR